MKILQVLLVSATTAYASASFALPALQLGGDGSSTWNYDTVTDTWIATGTDSFTLSAFANCDSATAGCDSPHGNYAWDDNGTTDRYAYLAVAAMPDLGDIGDIFDISVTGASLVNSGYGNPPIEDTNSISPHGIFDTYYEIYEFQFDGSIGTIYNTMPDCVAPDECDPGDGYAETFGINVNSLFEGVAGLHFDLFTVNGFRWDPSDTTLNKKLVNSVAPYSHDAQWNVPEPGIPALLGIGLIGLALRKKLKTQ